MRLLRIFQIVFFTVGFLSLSGLAYAKEFPDLVVQDVILENRILTAIVANEGTVGAQADKVGIFFWFNDDLRWTYSATTLADQSFLNAGGKSKIQPQILKENLSVKVCIDALEKIVETNEKNNCVKKLLVVDSTLPMPQKGPEFSVFPKESKLRFCLEKGSVRKMKKIKRKLNALVNAFEDEDLGEKAEELAFNWFLAGRTVLNNGLNALKVGDLEGAFELCHKLGAHLKEGQLLIRHLALLLEEEISREAIGEFEIPLSGIERDFAAAKQSYAFLVEELPKAINHISEQNRPLAKQYYEEWLLVSLAYLDKTHLALKGGDAKEAFAAVKAFVEQVKNGKQLLNKLANLANISVEKPKEIPAAIPLPPSADFKKIDPEKIKKVFEIPSLPTPSEPVDLFNRVAKLEKELREALSGVPEQYHDTMGKHVDQWSSVAQSNLQDFQNALHAGAKEKAFGLEKALLAHLNVGEQLLKKINGIAISPTPVEETTAVRGGGDVKFPVSVNCFPDCPGYYDKMLGDAYVNKYAVKPVTATRYEGILMETQQTGADASPATFVIKPGELFAFVAFLDKERALAETKRVFPVPPLKHFGALAASPESPICQIRFMDTEQPLIMQNTGLPSCFLSVSIPAQDKNFFADYTGWLPARPQMKAYKESKKEDVSAPPSVFSREKIEAVLLQTEQRFQQVESNLWQVIKLFSGKARPDAEKRVTQWTQVTRESRDDARTALANGQFEKAHGLTKAFEAHVQTGQNLISKLKSLLESSR